MSTEENATERNSGVTDTTISRALLDATFGNSITGTFDWSTVNRTSDTVTQIALPSVDVTEDGDRENCETQPVKFEPGAELVQGKTSDVKIDIESTSPSVLRGRLNQGEVVGKDGDVTELKIKVGKGETTVYKVANGDDNLYYDKDNVLIAREGPLGNGGRTVFQTIRDDAQKTARGALEFTQTGKLDREIRFDKNGRANGIWDASGREINFPRSQMPSITYGGEQNEAKKVLNSYSKVTEYRSKKK